ncbi:MAG: ATP-dependent sacrificial sulfur transferase LarE [Planctomycetota bacterium]
MANEIEISDDAERLIASLSMHERLFVAFSGGVDSSVVAAAAYRANPTFSAVTAQSPSVPEWQLQEARRVAGEIGIEHRIVSTHESEREDYRRNDRRRCYFCKDTLYDTLGSLAGGDSGVTIASGTNADDLGDYRPGIEAGRSRGVITPLADLHIGKRRVRELAAFFGLSNRDLPASPCLASRVAYGVTVTPERLKRIELSETFLREKGFNPLRVRLLENESARIEVGSALIESLQHLDRDGLVTRYLIELGFQTVEIDERGFKSGRLNETLTPNNLVQIGTPTQQRDPHLTSVQAPREASS